MRKAITLGLAAGLAMLGGGGAKATTTTSSFQVQLTLQAQCSILSASTLDFGTTGFITANVDATSTLNVQCTNPTPYNVGLDAGSNGGTVAARLLKGGPSNETIQYSLYTTSGRNTVW